MEHGIPSQSSQRVAFLIRCGAMAATSTPLDTTPLSVYLPFNREVLGIDFSPGKGGAVPKEGEGHWVLVQDQNLLVVPEGEQFRLPSGACPIQVDGEAPIWLGSLQGTPCWVLPVAKDRACPDGLQPQTLIPMRGTKLPDTLLSLGGMAMQALWWESTSGHCPRCGERTERISGEWGKKCPKCKYEHYPH